MYGRLGYLHLVHLAEANAQRSRLRSRAGAIPTSANAGGPARSEAGVFVRLAVVLGLALASAMALGAWIG